MKLLSVIFMNLWGYDILIFITAVFTAAVYHFLKKSADKLYKKMHLTVFVPDGGTSRREADRDISGMREQDVVAMRNHTGKLYSLFVNLTGIFPLLGILGTVISLLGLVADDTNVTGNFYGALTSTFWGLVFAIIFKFLDGIVSAKIEDNEKSVELYLSRNFKSSEVKGSEIKDAAETDEITVGEKKKPAPAKAENSDESKGLKLLKELFLGDSDEEE
ncbi:MotA/TolQ/ExbB proton channel family protein [uncultured Ruminococcus sp.]|uniref:MotA/TolQ/ExbB proton channel family protein n=1 Tax=uncultured Ruminococcus sp. TaxID=165186 RepID=UPI0025CFC9F3|nr:MotA/TolQ/ExbB proton channel family protein [uncultured Ruminococcus sp.]